MGPSSRSDQIGAIKYLHPVMLSILAFSIWLTLVLRAPEIWAVLASELTKLLQSPAVGLHLDAFLGLQNQQGFFENLSPRVSGWQGWVSFEFDPRSLSLGTRLRFVLIGSALDVSVIIPTLNEEKYLPKCLRSLADQNGDVPFEVIVVDGGSTDKTVEIAKQYADRVFVRARKPVGAARNTGAEQAAGEILAFIDADTYASANWLATIARGFKDKEVVGVTGPTLPYEGNIIDTVTYRLWTIYFQRILLSVGMPHVIGFNCAYRRDLFLHVGGFDENTVMSEDIRLALKMRQRGRITFEKEMFALTSPRRFRKFGHAYIAGLYLVNGFSTLLLNRSSRNYPPVR